MNGLQFADDTRHGLPSRVSKAQRERRYRQQSSLYLAKRLEDSTSQYVTSLPPNVARSRMMDCACLPGGQLVCGTGEGIHVLRQTAEAPRWDYVQNPLHSNGCSTPYPLRSSSSAGFAIGLDSGQYMVVSEGGASTSTGTHSNWNSGRMAAPRRRFGPDPAPRQRRNMASLTPQWNSSSPMHNLVELSTWRDPNDFDAEAVASSWDFWETGSSLLAMHAGFDYLGIQDYRKASFRENPTNNYEICFFRDNGGSESHERFSRCCFVSEHVVATTSDTLEDPLRLWDLRMTRGQSGALLSFPLDTAHEMRGWGLNSDNRPAVPHSSTWVKNIRRLDKDGRVLLNGHDNGFLLVDPLNESVQCLPARQLSSSSTDLYAAGGEALITMGSASILACRYESNTIDIVDVTEAGRSPLLALDNSQEVTASVPKRRKTDNRCPFPQTGRVIGGFLPDIADEYGLESTLSRMAWDTFSCRLFGISPDFDVFTWSL